MLVLSVVTDGFLAPPWWSEHPAWDGLTPYDLIFPTFVTLSGCGMAFAYARGVRSPLRLARRIVVLALLGLGYNAIMQGTTDLSSLRLFGVLQLYAVVVLVVSLTHVLTRSVRGWALVVLVWTVLLTGVHTWWTLRCGVVSPSCNPSRAWDLHASWLSHVYGQGRPGHDPEGIVSMAGATLQASIGALAGHLVLASRRGRWPIWRTLLSGVGSAAGLTLLGLGAVVAPSMLGATPLMVMKRLWTPPFALLTGAAVLLLLVIAHVLVDLGSDSAVRAKATLLRPLTALGRNSLLVYFGSHALTAVLRREPSFMSSVSQWGLWQLPALMLTLWLTVALVLDRFRIYLRA